VLPLPIDECPLVAGDSDAGFELPPPLPELLLLLLFLVSLLPPALLLPPVLLPPLELFLPEDVPPPPPPLVASPPFESLSSSSSLPLEESDLLTLSFLSAADFFSFLSFLALGLNSVMTTVKSFTVTLWYVAELRSTFFSRALLTLLVFLGSFGFLGALGSLAPADEEGAGLLLALRLASAAKSVSSSSPAPA